MLKAIIIKVSLFCFFMAAESSAMNETTPSLEQQENVTNIDVCPRQIEYDVFMSGYEAKNKKNYGAQFELDRYTIQISSNSMALVDKIKKQVNVKKLKHSDIYFGRQNNIQRGRCVYFLTPKLIYSGEKLEAPFEISFGISMKLNSQTKTMTPEEENSQKLMIFHEALKGHADTLKKKGEEQKDVTKKVGTTLHALYANPVLDATLEYTNPKTKESVSFKIGDNVTDGIVDLPVKAFGDVANHLLITTDPNVFLAKHEKKVALLIAPWSLINNNSSTYGRFYKAMQAWDEKTAPIGIFFLLNNDPGYSYNLINKEQAKKEISIWDDLVGQGPGWSKVFNTSVYYDFLGLKLKLNLK
jgi:hypothetical protein